MKHAKWQNIRIPALPGWTTPLLLLLLSVVLCCISLFFGSGNDSSGLLRWLLGDYRLVLLNTLPFLLLCLFFWLLTDRAWAGATAGGVLCLVYSWAEYWKLMSRGEPIYAGDLLLIREAVHIGGRYVFVTGAMVLSLLIVLCLVVLFRLFCRSRLHSLSLRAALCLALVLIGVGAYSQIYTDTTLYDAFSIYPAFHEDSEKARYLSTGGLYPFLHSTQRAAQVAEPEHYHEKTARELLLEYEESDIPADRRVNVVCVMLEAMADLSKCTDLITGNDPYLKYHQLEATSYSGTLVTNIFAGGTIDTERSVITGFPILGSFETPSWSYARYFGAQGYTVLGGHAWNIDFYNRGTVNANLGFPDYHYIENYYSGFIDGTPWDDRFFPDITETCLTGAQSSPVFSYNVSYQNHGPYTDDTAYFTEEYLPRGVVDDATYYSLNNYLVGVEDTWNCIYDMLNAFAASEQPFVVVLFGDHKPWMGNQNSGYEALGIDLSLGNPEGFLNYYTTDYMIWANDAAKTVTGNQFEGTGPTISACYLMNLLFEQCGWEGPAYQKLSDELLALLPVVSSTGTYLQNGALVSASALGEDAKEKLHELQQAAYYLAKDYLQAGGDEESAESAESME